MSDQIVETSSLGWGGRILQSLKGVLFGLVLFVVAFPLLWWNEGRAVQTYRSLKEGAAAVVAIDAGEVLPANQGRLVHVSGRAVTDATLTDPTFGVSANALVLERKAEMYQWVETVSTSKRKKLGGGEETVKTYSYAKEWRDRLLDSSEFKEPAGHQNPREMQVDSWAARAKPVTVGAFTLPDALVDRIDAREPIEVTESMIQGGAAAVAEGEATHAAPAPKAQVRAQTGGKAAKGAKAAVHGQARHAAARAGGNRAPAASRGPAFAAPYRLDHGSIYLWKAKPAAPAVGDLRVSFSKVVPADVSIIAAQVGSSFGPYQTRAGDALEILRPGVLGAAAMFKAEERENAILTWIVRLVGFLLMTAGIALVLRPLAVVADVLPFLGDILRLGLGLVAVAVALPLTLVTIAVAWLAHRPVVGVALLVTGVLAFALVKVMAQRKRAAAAPAAQAAAG